MTVAQTSIEAFQEMSSHLGPLQQAVLREIRHRPLSNRELSICLGVPEKSITGRTGELRDLGLIRFKEYQKNPNGRREQVWEIVK